SRRGSAADSSAWLLRRGFDEDAVGDLLAQWLDVLKRGVEGGGRRGGDGRASETGSRAPREPLIEPRALVKRETRAFNGQAHVYPIPTVGIEREWPCVDVDGARGHGLLDRTRVDHASNLRG